MKVYQKKNSIQRLAIITVIVFVFAQTVAAQTTAFNFQGRLNDGSSPANGSYDLRFRLYDSATDGEQIDSTITKLHTTLINGVFSTTLDFGLSAFDGDTRYIEISLRQNGSGNAYVILGPRQRILSVPYTIRSRRASIADNATHATTATNADNATNAANADNLGGTPAAKYLKIDGNGNVGIGGTDPSQFPSRLYVDGGSALGGYGSALHAKGDALFEGNLTQPLTANGLPKALLLIDRDGNIVRCYNGITGASTGNCGFTVSHTQIGIYSLSLGFSINNLIINVTPYFDEKFVVANIDPFNASRIFVTYNDSNQSTNAALNIVVY